DVNAGGQEGSSGVVGQSGPPDGNLPNLDVARNLRSGRIHANLCPPDDPDYPNCFGGGGGGLNDPPTADPGGPYTGHAGSSVSFAGLGIPGSGSIVSYFWTFGDGGSTSG